MRVQLLGPLRVWDGVGWIPVPAGQPRVVLAVLLAETGRVSIERLVDELWGQRPPPTAVKTIQVYVTRLRRMLASVTGPALVTRGHGYELVVGDEDVDAAVFERLVAAARPGQLESRPEVVADRLAEALALWRGPALDDVPPSPTVTAWAARLEQTRLNAAEDRLDAVLDTGRHADVVDELRRLVDARPLRERLWAQLMLALYRCDRRAEALETYRQARHALADELGLEPGPRLRELHQAILAGEPPPVPQAGQTVAAAGAPSPPLPAQLPADVAGFTGRRAQLKRLDALLSTAVATTTAVVVISTVAGTAGVGKTALAVHWAHRVRDRFPDGQLFVDLRGYAADRPVQPIEALARFLRALGVPAEHVPSNVDEAAALYRSLLAEKRMLVLLDNASDSDHVRPLLPAGAGCLALVTSRNRLAGLAARNGASVLVLDVLTVEEAQALLRRLLGPGRIAAEPAAAADLAGLCGYLPLALRIAAANLSARTRTTLADYAARLRHNRLDRLAVDGDAGDSVRATFGHSYAALAAPVRHLFRLLGLVPGPDITAPAAAALAGTGVADTAVRLDQLAAAHLVDERTPGRYAPHDLLRQYAIELAAAEDSEAEREDALDRWYRCYLDGVDAAAQLVYPEITRLPSPTADTAAFTDHGAALAWLDAERANVVAAVQHAAARGRNQIAWRLADALRGYLYLRLHAADWNTVARAALTAAAADRDPQACAAAHLSLATLDIARGRSGQAIDWYEPAIALAHQARWAEGEAAALGGLGTAHFEMGQLEQAAEYLERALAIDRSTGQTGGQALRLGSLGQVQWILGRLRPAAEHCAEALALHRRAGSHTGEAWALECLGGIQHELGHLGQACEILTQAHALYQETGHHGQAGTVRALAEVHRDAGRLRQALELASRALVLARDDGDRRNEADALAARASVRCRLRQHLQAIDDYRQALDRAREITNPYIEARALTGLADAHHRVRQLDDAMNAVTAALAIAQQAGYRLLEGEARTVLARLRLDQGQSEQALADADHAVRIHEATGHRLGQAHAHVVAAAVHREIGNATQAREHSRAARTLYADTGAAPP